LVILTYTDVRITMHGSENIMFFRLHELLVEFSCLRSCWHTNFFIYRPHKEKLSDMRSGEIAG